MKLFPTIPIFLWLFTYYASTKDIEYTSKGIRIFEINLLHDPEVRFLEITRHFKPVINKVIDKYLDMIPSSLQYLIKFSDKAL